MCAALGSPSFPVPTSVTAATLTDPVCTPHSSTKKDFAFKICL